MDGVRVKGPIRIGRIVLADVSLAQMGVGRQVVAATWRRHLVAVAPATARRRAGRPVAAFAAGDGAEQLGQLVLEAGEDLAE
ncbi:hypothetical protein HH310_02950 [Actinoplanes sp. TBRC 11911]|uniref:hypothetical protein n=1 Tax=Actinoplanes sp. TBRC 11911 TaxID=2729386 RepID=UPI00145ED59B|nr:hypothetical protein [Actinoplanes sp. TBRC 11911]NMO50149.1 hypothetical protein [Actinoplanes sp. TBRC 11911]